MSSKIITGKITFIHHEKERAVIEYSENNKKKTIQADINPYPLHKKEGVTVARNPHRYLIGDHVNFTIKKTGANGKIQYASDLQYLYNTTLELLINKALEENKFLGYVKQTGKEFFIKEIDSYLFFPLKISAYEVAPVIEENQKPVQFKLEQIDTPEKIVAVLYNHTYIPEFLPAVQAFKKKTSMEATVTKITPFGVYVTLYDGKITSKLALNDLLNQKITDQLIQVGTVLPVVISHLNADRIVVVLETKSEG